MKPRNWWIQSSLCPMVGNGVQMGKVVGQVHGRECILAGLQQAVERVVVNKGWSQL